MANNPHFKLTSRNAMLDTLNASIGSTAAFIIYAGNQPADCSSAVTAGNTSCARLYMAATAFAAATGGVITANAIASDSSAAGGTANWFSVENTTGDGTTRFIDGDVDTSGADLNLNSVSITTGATVAVSSFTVTMSA